ncbi:hypothetical protein [Halosimplex salinum]|uniref:hypothetical protein n=1 Tax=Halosimplex salinum TaxID=1710538 RepID=UPI000F464DA0|nr:hypothetical protein [Halosimplex salinum]
MADENADETTVPVICSDCGTETAIAIDDVAEAVERHNDQLHDGEEVASVDPVIAEQVTDLVAEELGLLEPSEE